MEETSVRKYSGDSSGEKPERRQAAVWRAADVQSAGDQRLYNGADGRRHHHPMQESIPGNLQHIHAEFAIQHAQNGHTRPSARRLRRLIKQEGGFTASAGQSLDLPLMNFPNRREVAKFIPVFRGNQLCRKILMQSWRDSNLLKDSLFYGPRFVFDWRWRNC